MIHSFSLSNFKAFGQEQHVPIRPITLIFGANSSGKSSLLHALMLARHALIRGSWDANHLELAGNSVELGGFVNYLHRKDQNPGKAMSFSLERAMGATNQPYSMILEGVRQLRIALTISHSSVGACRLQSCEVDVDGARLFLLASKDDAQMGFNLWETDHALNEKFVSRVCSLASAERVESSAQVKEEVTDILRHAVLDSFSFLPSGVTFPAGITPDESELKKLLPNAQTPVEERLKIAVRSLLPTTVKELLSAIHDFFSADIDALEYLGPLRSYPSRLLSDDEATDPNWRAGGGFAWKRVRQDRDVRNKVNNWLGQKLLNSKYRLETRQLVDEHVLLRRLEASLTIHDEQLIVDAARREAKGTSLSNELGLSNLNCGEYLEANPDLRDQLIENVKFAFTDSQAFANEDEDEQQNLIESAAEDYVNNEIYHDGGALLGEIRDHYLESLTDVSSVALSLSDPVKAATRITNALIEEAGTRRVPELILVDERSNTDVTHRDVGIGISQVLPVLVHALGSKNKIIVIEQPEIHLHPALQAELGDLFIESALGENGNCFILETHSEHLLLRMMKAIRETSAGKRREGALALRPDQISVLFVEPGGTGSIVRDMKLNNQGELVKGWPGGFFEEGLNEMFDS